jgi:hypothetical protein
VVSTRYAEPEWFTTPGSPVLVVRFETEAVRRSCCDTADVQPWAAIRRCISRRFQQLEAMVSLEDLAFMPFDSVRHADGSVELELDDETSLFVREESPAKEDSAVPAVVVMVTAIGTRRMSVV